MQNEKQKQYLSGFQDCYNVFFKAGGTVDQNKLRKELIKLKLRKGENNEQ